MDPAERKIPRPVSKIHFLTRRTVKFLNALNELAVAINT